MAESTLTLTRLLLKEAVARYLPGSGTLADWTAEMLADLARIVAAGERQFYSPVLKTANPNAPVKSHVWSFLSPKLSLSISNGTATYDLPDDFSGFLDKELAFTTSKDWPVKLVEMWRVVEKIQAGTTMPTGITQPLLGAVQPKTQTLGTTGLRWQILLWPTPTTSLTLTGRYRSAPAALADDTHYPLGGELHAETLLESCLAAAEEFMNDQSSVHRERFEQLLAASVALDVRLHQSEAA